MIKYQVILLIRALIYADGEVVRILLRIRTFISRTLLAPMCFAFSFSQFLGLISGFRYVDDRDCFTPMRVSVIGDHAPQFVESSDQDLKGGICVDSE